MCDDEFDTNDAASAFAGFVIFIVLFCMMFCGGLVLFIDICFTHYADTAYVAPSDGGYVVVLKTTGIKDVVVTNPLPLSEAEGIAKDYNVMLWDRQLRPSAGRTK